MCKISIIVPVYNAEKHINETISSLLNQTINDIEVICIDDGSIDNTADCLNKISKVDPRLVLIKKDNSGPGASRNLGIKKARGKYLMFVDSDDLLCLDACELLFEEAEATSSDLLIGKYNPFVTPNEVIVECNRSSETIQYTEFFTPYLWDKLWNRDFFITNRLYNLEQFYCEDQVSVIKAILSARNINNTNLVFYNYRDNPKSIMNQKLEYRHTLNRMNSLYVTFELIKSNNSTLSMGIVNYLGNSLFYLLNSPRASDEVKIIEFSKELQKFIWKYSSYRVLINGARRKSNLYVFTPSFLWSMASFLLNVNRKIKSIFTLAK
nr:hypothetical protein BCT98_09395 [Vibrio breoganii]